MNPGHAPIPTLQATLHRTDQRAGGSPIPAAVAVAVIADGTSEVPALGAAAAKKVCYIVRQAMLVQLMTYAPQVNSTYDLWPATCHLPASCLPAIRRLNITCQVAR